jgi:hypothetical protein
MYDTCAILFKIRSPETSCELLVDAPSARIGSGGHCEIRLGADDVAFEQVFLEARTTSLYAEVRSTERPVLLNGAPFLQGLLLPDSVLHLGNVEVRAELVDHAAAARKPNRDRDRRRSLLAVGALVLAVVGVGLASRLRKVDTGLELMAAPALWANESAARCEQQGPEQALALAHDLMLRGTTARERAPFNPEDGVHAVEHFSRARACFLQAKDGVAARQAAVAGTQLKESLAREFHIHQARMERALSTGKYASARTETNILLSFGAVNQDPYFGWLATLDRHLELQFAGRKEP